MSSEGHVLARLLITKHGVDRYPTAVLNLGKTSEEVGELWGAVLKRPARGSQGDAAIRKEYADVGLALYALGDKLGLDLITEMAAIVDGETRSFAAKGAVTAAIEIARQIRSANTAVRAAEILMGTHCPACDGNLGSCGHADSVVPLALWDRTEGQS